jgi:hypothetical protein
MEMEMAEFQDFVNECNLVTKEVQPRADDSPNHKSSPSPDP